MFHYFFFSPNHSTRNYKAFHHYHRQQRQSKGVDSNFRHIFALSLRITLEISEHHDQVNTAHFMCSESFICVHRRYGSREYRERWKTTALFHLRTSHSNIITCIYRDVDIQFRFLLCSSNSIKPINIIICFESIIFIAKARERIIFIEETSRRMAIRLLVQSQTPHSIPFSLNKPITREWESARQRARAKMKNVCTHIDTLELVSSKAALALHNHPMSSMWSHIK